MASLIPGFEYDIFISYRQKDNRYDGWVTEFVENLKKELDATFKEDVTIYFDINPHDGLLETHDVDASLKEKLKCLVFIPVISRTYCDPKSFAWEHEFKVFIDEAAIDQFGLKVSLQGGNIANRVLPVRIHDLDSADIRLFESTLGTVLRPVDFVYKETGVNRHLRAKDDDVIKSPGQLFYRDQINKVALAVRDIIESIKSKSDAGIATDLNDKIPDKPNREALASTGKQKKISTRLLIICIVSLILIFTAGSILFLKHQKKKQYARNELLPQIQKMVEDNFYAPSKAFELAAEAQKYIPKDPILISLWPRISEIDSLQTQPEGAKVLWKDYQRPDDPWKEIGITPFRNVRVPLGYKRIMVEKDGFQSCFLTGFNLLDPGMPLKLDSIGSIPLNMVRIPSKIISGIGGPASGKKIPEFLVDKYEVTNKEYKRFVDFGGYTNKKYWSYPIYSNEIEIPWDSAMKIFQDRTGKNGPAGWEVATYPDGEDNHPVTGVSWYEAAAYASFAGKKLPTIYHWQMITEPARGMYFIPMSNFGGKSTVPVGSLPGISSFGIFDLAGNSREWCFNGNDVKGNAAIAGGGWNDPPYAFTGYYFQPALDRSISNGFRCIMELTSDTLNNSLSRPAIFLRKPRDYSLDKPVDGMTFNSFLRLYDYDRTPLNPKVQKLLETGVYIAEKVTIDAAYNSERFDVYIFIPKGVVPPFQPILFCDGANVIYDTVYHMVETMADLEFILKSGRALVFPVLKGTLNRYDGLKNDGPTETVNYRDHLVMWRKDCGRAIDYLETRNDMLLEKLGYLGWSWGGFLGGIIPAIEKRIKAVVLNAGGMDNEKALPEADQLNFLPRIDQPLLLLNGKYDPYYPTHLPMIELIGSKIKEKKLYETGHLVPRLDFIKETTAWYDRYLGPVK